MLTEDLILTDVYYVNFVRVTSLLLYVRSEYKGNRLVPGDSHDVHLAVVWT